jgi:hypothetical protein
VTWATSFHVQNVGFDLKHVAQFVNFIKNSMFYGCERIKKCTHLDYGIRYWEYCNMLSDFITRREFLAQQTDYKRHEKDGIIILD